MISEEIFHYDEIQFNLQMNSKVSACLFLPFLCGTWKPEKQLWLTLGWGHCSTVTVGALPPFSYYGAAEETPTPTANQLQIQYCVFPSVMVCSCLLPSLKSKAIDITCISSHGNLFLSQALGAQSLYGKHVSMLHCSARDGQVEARGEQGCTRCSAELLS